MHVRAMVEVSSGYEAREKLWAYGYKELADLFGVTKRTIALWESKKMLDPADLRSVIHMALIRCPEFMELLTHVEE
jgi:transcriptional regulator with XRE-family HTH domain